MDLAHSSLERYEKCPLYFRFTRIDSLRTSPQAYFSFGSTIHNALKFLYTDSLFELPTLQDFIRYYRWNWLTDGYQDRDEMAEYFRLGLDILARFYKKEKAERPNPIAVEFRFRIKLKNCNLVGYVDRIDRCDDGVEIIDYKTSKTLHSTDNLKTDRQFAIYQLGVERNFNLPVKRLTLYHLRSLTKISIPAHDSYLIEDLIEWIETIAERINREEFKPRLHNDCPCEFSDCCPYFRQTEPEPEIAAIVDEYGELVEKHKEEQKRIQNLRDLIIDYLDRNKIEQIFGRRFSVSRQYIDITSLRRSVSEVIDNNNLWEEVGLYLESKGISVETKERRISRINLRRRDV